MIKCNQKVAIGIDLGTTTCTVGVVHNGEVEIIINEGGHPISSNCLAFTEDGKLVGELKKSQGSSCARNAICDSMRLVGRCYEKEMEHDMSMVPFKVVKVDGHPAVEIACRNADRRFTPVEVSSMILQQVKEFAECFVGKPIDDAVITVPVYFNDQQRLAVKEAANKAGLNVYLLMNEPVAAALAYGFLQKPGKSYAVVYDLGGGTLDVSVFAISDGVFDLKATSGNTQLGGKDFDAAMVGHFAKEIKEKYGVDIKKEPNAMRRLEAVCEQAKRCLSTYNKAIIKIEGLVRGISFKSSLSRAKFEELNADLFNSTLTSIEDALYDANVSKECVNEIVLVGGSTKIPKIQSILKEFFSGKELTQTINPEEAVAYGAALQASVIAKEESEKSTEVELHAAPLSIGIKSAGGVMAIFVPRNTPLPCSFTHEFSTYTDNQPTVLIEVYEGERLLAKDNNHLADLELTGLPLAPRGVPRIEVTFCMDKSGIVIVTAREKATGVKNAIMITDTSARVSQEVERMVKESEKKKKEDEEGICNARFRRGLESYCLDLLGCTNNLKDVKFKVVNAKASSALKWLEDNPKATKEDIASRHQDIEKSCAGALAFLFHNKSQTSTYEVVEDGCKSDETEPEC